MRQRRIFIKGGLTDDFNFDTSPDKTIRLSPTIKPFRLLVNRSGRGEDRLLFTIFVGVIIEG